ncbi:hypothetical protein L228DRAFT_264350 [Xylona heveae TC161]|uniref:C2H2-type domain-containing protein n=1 Tax=Xylona heveae (strain CBS 132557 / TC161) TaxID=1328760 RepID=A0A165J902_XYLHT|nr:hypothetical protein L228DRAFT_264350 [Xylona heveae TC161]KZF25913.1 hypothetical protein L228DRAFT_264350 [Xylona heveae TC161]
MTMAVDSQHRTLGSFGFDNLAYSGAPHFTNPWATATTAANSSSHYFPTSLGSANLGLDAIAKQQAARTHNASMPYSSVPVTAPTTLGATAGNGLSMASYAQPDLQGISQDLLNAPRSYAAQPTYSTEPSSTSHAYAPNPTEPFAQMDYTKAHYPTAPQPNQYQDHSRRLSQPSVPSSTFLGAPAGPYRQRQSSLVDFNDRGTTSSSQQPPRSTFSDALDAGRGMVAMSQDITPRNIYGPRAGRGSNDSYGFPSHSPSSSISSASTYPSYYGSVDSSVTDYSSTSDPLEPLSSRTLPRPSGLVGSNVAVPPAPQSMMTQFSSKVASSSQKKHKCKICDKRFTRPSSLQTHMYSHTGEKPFCCEVEGCGRHFSVVSNLRRHRKVHSGARDHRPSPE